MKKSTKSKSASTKPTLPKTTSLSNSSNANNSGSSSSSSSSHAHFEEDAMLNNSFDRETRFAQLLQPIQDLTKNWNIDIASELEEYLNEVREREKERTVAF